jgi:predicted  nucleic acid-binding Zn-ribbon protein
MAWFINYYRCPQCGQTWCDEWSAMCDDDCPHCGTRHISPYQSDEETPEPIEILKDLAETFRRISGTAENFSAEDKLAMLREHEDGVFAALEGDEDE